MNTANYLSWRRIYIAIVLSLTTVLFLPLRNNYFFADDFYNLIVAAETTSISDFFRPNFQHFGLLLRLYYFVMYHSFGLNYSTYFYFMLSIYLLNLLLSYYLLCQVFDSPLPLLMLPLYAWNPLFVEIVNWQCQIAQLLCLIFILLTLISLTIYAKSNFTQARWLALSISSSILSISAFTVGALIPLIVGLYYYMVLKKKITMNFKPDVKVLAGFFCIAIVYLVFALRRHHGIPMNLSSAVPMLIKYVTGSIFYVLIPSFAGYGPVKKEAALPLAIYACSCLAMVGVLMVVLRKELRWKLLLFALFYTVSIYILQGIARLHIYGYAITYWLRYNTFQIIAGCIALGELLRAISSRCKAKGVGWRVTALIAFQIFFLCGSSEYIGRENVRLQQTFHYGKIKSYITHIKVSYESLKDRLMDNRVIFLDRKGIVPTWIMDHDLSPLNRQIHFLRIILPKDKGIKGARKKTDVPLYVIDESGFFKRVS